MSADFPHRDEVDEANRREAPGTNDRPARESDQSGSGERRGTGGGSIQSPSRPALTERERRERWPIG